MAGRATCLLALFRLGQYCALDAADQLSDDAAYSRSASEHHQQYNHTTSPADQCG
jgi:hypothetical protein